MTEIFSTLFGQSDAQAPPSSAALSFGPGKPPPPLPQSSAPGPPQLSGQLGDEGPTARKPGVINEPFYLLRELPGKLDLLSDLLKHAALLTSVQPLCSLHVIMYVCLSNSWKRFNGKHKSDYTLQSGACIQQVLR